MSANAGTLTLIVDSTSVAQGERALDNIARTGARTEKSVKGDMSQIEAAMARLGQKSATIDKTLNASLGRTAAISKTVARGLVSLAAGFTSIAAVKHAVTEARNFNAALSETSTLLEGTPAQMEALRTSAMDLSRAYGGSATAQVEAFYQAISAGAGNVSQAEQLLDQANKLAIGGVTSVTTGVDALTTAVNAYEAQGLTAAQASDALFVGMKAGKTTVGELGGELGQVVPIAAAAGVSFDEVVAGVAALTTQGQTTAMATTGLRQVIASVIAPTKQASDMAAQLGIAFNAQSLEAQGLAAFLDQVVEKTGGNTEAMAQLFGSVEALNAALAFAGGAGGTFSEIMADMAEKAGATDEAFRKVADSLDKRMSFAFGKIGTLVTQFGTAILTVTVPAIEAIAAGADFLSQNFDSVTGIVISSAAALTIYYIPAVYGAVAATGAWIASLITLKGALLATGIGALVVGAGLLVGEFLKLVRATGGWGNALTLLGDVASGVWEGIKGSALSIVPALGAVWADMQAGFVHVLEAMSLQWGNFLWGLGSKLDGIPLFGSMAQSLKDASDRAIDGMIGLNAEASALEGRAIRLRNEAASMATDGFDKAREAARKLAEALAATESESGDTSDQAAKLKKILDSLSASTGKTGKAVKAAKDEAKAFADALKEAADTAEELGTKKANILIGGIDGVSGAWGDFVARGFSDFEGFTQSVLDSFKGMLSDMIALAARNQIMISMGLNPMGGVGGAVSAVGAAGGAGDGAGNLLGLGNMLGGAGGFLSGISGGFGIGMSNLFGGGLGTYFSGLGAQLGATFAGGFSASALGGLLGMAGPIAIGIGILAKGLSQKYAGTALRGTIDTGGFDGRSFDFYRGGFLRGNKEIDRDVPEELALYLDSAMTGVVGSIETYADALALSTKKAFRVAGEEFTIWLSDLDDQGIIDALNSEVQAVADEMAALVLGTDRFTRGGESAMEALTRLGSGLMAVNDAADLLGHRMWAVSLRSADAASELVELLGGLDAMTAAVGTYFATVYSEEERLAITTRRLTDVYGDLGLAMPKSRDQYRALVESIDTTTDAGRELYATLISMAGALDAVLPSVSSLTKAIMDLQGTTQSGLDLAISTAEAAAKANSKAAGDWYKSSDSIRTYIDKLRGSDTALTSPTQARAFNEMQFQTNLAAALAGDLNAAGNLTGNAESLRSSVNATATTRLEAALAEARILSDLGLAAGVGDIEGARHDVIAGLLTDQADLMQQTADYLAAGNALTEDQIATLTTQLGTLDDAIAAAELINYAYLKERLAVTVDVLADADVPAYLRNLLTNAAEGVTGYIDFITRSDLTPDLKWLALVGASEHVKTIEYLAENDLGRDLTKLAVDTVSTLEKTVHLLAGAGLDRDTMQIALAGNSELSRVVNVTLAADADEQAKELALENIGDYSVAVMASLDPGISDRVRKIVFKEQGTYAATIEAAISADISDRGRRILLKQQGDYIANIDGTLSSEMPNWKRRLLINKATDATRTVTLDVFDGDLTDAQKALLDAVNGSKDGKLTLGGSFTFDPSKSFETLLGDSIEKPMDAARIAMGTLTGSLGSLRAAIAAETISREATTIAAQGAVAKNSLLDSRATRSATASDLRNIFASAGVTSLGKGISFEDGMLGADGYWSGTAAQFDQVMEALRSAYDIKGSTIAGLTSQIFDSVNNPITGAKDDLAALRAAYFGVTGEVASFDGGGQLGDWGRSGGLDGKGGRLGLLHPREKVTTENQNAELVAELRALRAEVRALKEQSEKLGAAGNNDLRKLRALEEKREAESA